MRRTFTVVIVALHLCMGVWLAPVSAATTGVVLKHLTYSGQGLDWTQYLQTMAKRFKETTGITVSIVRSASNADFTVKLTSMIAGGAPPDVTDASPAIAGRLIKQNAFEDLKPYITKTGLSLKNIPPAAVQGSTTDTGVMWSIPVSVYPTATLFNADLFKHSGLQNPVQLNEKWNWDTMLQSARRLTVDTNGDGKTDRYGVSRLEWRWDSQVHQAGGKLYNRTVLPDKSLFNTPEVLKATKYLYNMIAVEKVASLSGATYNVWTGNCGFSLAYGALAIPVYMQKVPFAWDVAVYPSGPANRANRINPDGFQIISTSKQKEAAWKWINFLVGSAAQQVEMAKMTSRMPALREAMLDYAKAMPGLPQHWQVYITQAFDEAAYSPYVVLNSQIDTQVNNMLDKIWRGQVTPEAALVQLDEQVTPLLTK